MGRFLYGTDTAATFDDRTLAHLQAVILTKVRRGEGFLFSWSDDMSTGGGRTGVHLHANSTLAFRYTRSETVTLNPAWLQVLTEAANSGTGLYLVPEPRDPAPSSTIPTKSS